MPKNIQLPFLPKINEEKEQSQTQAQSVKELNQSFVGCIANKLAQIPQILQRQQTIAANLSSNVFSADKIFKTSSSLMKVLKAYNLVPEIHSLDKLSGEVSQIRRLLRVDRLLMVVKQLSGFLKKKSTTKTDKFMIIFKLMIMVEDLTDLCSYLIQLKLLQKDHLLVGLRKNVANLYFFECMGWLIYHLRQYIKSKNAEDKQKNKIAIIKYVLDGLVAHNDFSLKTFSIDPKITLAMSLTSAFLNLYLVWK